MSAAAAKMTQPPTAQGPDGPPYLSEAEFKRIAAILYEDSGIHLGEGKASLVYSRLAKRLRTLGLESFREYCALVSSSEGLGERQAMLSALTTNVTRFFREDHHFEDLGEFLRTELVVRAKAGGRVRLWSAACSSGEEPYSMALCVLAALPDAAKYDVRILATDIDSLIVEKARKGVYSREACDSIPSHMRERWMDQLPSRDLRVGEAVRNLITFNDLNLMADWPMKGRFDAIFCRNVAIYFEEATQERLWGRFAPLLTPAGRLYIGHSERVADKRFTTAGLTTYRLASASA